MWVTGRTLNRRRLICTQTSSPCAARFHVPRGLRIRIHWQPTKDAYRDRDKLEQLERGPTRFAWDDGQVARRERSEDALDHEEPE